MILSRRQIERSKLKKYFQKDELIEDEDKEFQKKSFDYIEQLLKQGLSEFWIIKGLAGLDSEEAWNLRKYFLKKQRIPIDVDMVSSLTGLDSKKAWKMREKFLEEGVGKSNLASSPTGLDSERAWEFREQLLKDGIDKSWIAAGLTGLNSERAWKIRKQFLEEKVGDNKGLIATGVYGNYLMAAVRKARKDKELKVN